MRSREVRAWQSLNAEDMASRKVDADTASNSEDFFAYIASRQ
jgi:hypothetical protein